MATYAIGDIHGYLPPLADLLGQLRPLVTADDVVVFLGDYIDRGPDTRRCIDEILSFRSSTPGRVVALYGNHEDWMLKTMRDYTRHSWLLGMDPVSTIASYSPSAAQAIHEAANAAGLLLAIGRYRLPYESFFDALPQEHREFFETLVPSYVTDDCICSHGGLDPAITSVSYQLRRSLIWGADGFPDEYEGEKIVVYGHHNNAVRDVRGWPLPRFVGNTIGVDTIAHGVLTAIRLPDRAVFQSARYAAIAEAT
jgi:serine/threonine protein phosphatase 1